MCFYKRNLKRTQFKDGKKKKHTQSTTNTAIKAMILTLHYPLTKPQHFISVSYKVEVSSITNRLIFILLLINHTQPHTHFILYEYMPNFSGGSSSPGPEHPLRRLSASPLCKFRRPRSPPASAPPGIATILCSFRQPRRGPKFELGSLKHRLRACHVAKKSQL